MLFLRYLDRTKVNSELKQIKTNVQNRNHRNRLKNWSIFTRRAQQNTHVARFLVRIEQKNFHPEES